MSRIARFVPFVISACLSVAIIFAAMYLAGLFFETSPEPVIIRVARSCTPDSDPPSFLAILPAGAVTIFPHGALSGGNLAAGKCSAVAICTPLGRLKRYKDVYKAQPETDKEMCWAFATAPENIPNGADRSVYRILKDDDLREFTFFPERSFAKRISFSRWAVNLLIAAEQPVPAGLPLEKMENAIPRSQIRVMLMFGRTLVTSTPPSTRASREGQFTGENDKQEDLEIFEFADTTTTLPGEPDGIYLIYESERHATLREFLLFLLAGLLGALLPTIPAAWDLIRQSWRD